MEFLSALSHALAPVAANALSVPVEDSCIALVKALSPLVAPTAAPARTALISAIRSFAPAPLAAFQRWTSATRSSHAARLPLMDPFDALLAVVLYVAVVSAGCVVMRFLPRLPVTGFALVHNFILFALSAYMCVKTYLVAAKDGYNIFKFGNSIDFSSAGFPVAKILWLFYFSKIIEFIDTFIMVAKKNFRQISFLHIYHHASILLVQWYINHYVPGGESVLPAVLNSFIHIVMYGYYFFSALGFRFVSIVKPYITIMQMTQFVILLAQGIAAAYIPMAYPGATNYPAGPGFMLVTYMVSMLILFGNFFVQDRRRAALAKAAEKNQKIKKNK